MSIISRVKITDSYRSYKEALDHMTEQDVKHLGWLNSGIKTPERCKFEKVYSNRSGSSCLYCDVIRRLAYSVDMGD